jgi:hypothetical protein
MAENSPLRGVSARFKQKASRLPVRNTKPTSDILDLLEAKANSNTCFIIGNDRSVFKADPEKCANTARYEKVNKL